MPLTDAGQRVTAALLSLDYGLADTDAHTVTQATATALSTSYATDGGEQAGVAYRLTAFGTGTWASSGPQQLNIAGCIAGVQIMVVGIASGTFATSQAIDWRATLTIIVQTPGSSGTVNALLDTAVTANQASAGDQGQPAVRAVTGQAINTSLSNAVQLQAYWATTTGSPTITCDGATFEKLGG